jgi:hypothetical protein
MWLDPSGPSQVPVTSICKDDNEISCSIKEGEIIELALLKKNSTPWRYLVH